MRIEEVRTSLVTRLRRRQREVEQATIARVRAVTDSQEVVDPEYLEGLRSTISAAIVYGIEALEHSGDRTPIPTALLSQARLAARNRVGLDTVLRRYLAGYSVLSDFVIEEAERIGQLSQSSVKSLMRAQAVLLDRVLVAVSEEYAREIEGQVHSPAKRQTQRVQRLIIGELVDTAELGYAFEDRWHLGLVATGMGASQALRDLCRGFDAQLLHVDASEETGWAWLGSRHRIEPADICERTLTGRFYCAIGEPARDLSGWRLTHKQATAAMSVARRGLEACVRYGDVALLAAIIQDDLVMTSLRQLYLEPLSDERDDGKVLRETLRAYFAAEHNISSAASSLGVNRQTVTKRLRLIEKRLDSCLSGCSSEIDVALRLEDLKLQKGTQIDQALAIS